MFKPTDLFDLTQTQHAALFDGCELAWDALKKLKAYIEAQTRNAPPHAFGPGVFIGPHVLIGEGTVIEDGAMIKGPAIIGRNCEIRHGAYVRDHVIVGDGCVIGNSSELKHSLLFNGCQVPHFNYVGDSLLGHKAHLGAGVICSNLKSLPGNVTVDLLKAFPAQAYVVSSDGNRHGHPDDLAIARIVDTVPGSMVYFNYPGPAYRRWLEFSADDPARVHVSSTLTKILTIELPLTDQQSHRLA